MRDQDKTKKQLISELEELRQRLRARESGNHRDQQEYGPWVPDGSPWHSLLANTPMVTVILDEKHFIRFANHADSGANLNEVLGRSLYDFCRPEYRETVRACVQRVFQTGKPSMYECPVLRLDDQEHWYASNCAPIFADSRVVAVALISYNITERKRAEEKLRNSERTLRTLIDASPESILLLDAAGTILLANETIAARLGRPVNQMVGRTPHELLPPEVAANRMRHFEEVVRTGKPVRFDDQRLGRYLENVIYPILDDQGKIISVAVLGIDQTDDRRAEEALKKARDELEEKVKERTAELAIFRRFADSSDHGFVMADMEGRITYMNPALCQMAGVAKPDDAIGKRSTTYYPEGYMLRRTMEILPTLLKEGHWEGELVVSPAGKTMYVVQNSFLIRDENGNPFRLAAVISDITERKRAEEALRAGNERYELAVQGVGVGIWDYDIRTGKVYYSPRWKALFGYEEDDIGDSLEDWSRLVHPDERDQILKFQEDFLAGSSSTVSVEYRLRHKDGSYRWIIAHGLAVRDSQGKAIRFVGSHGDITDRKRAEEALERERQSLWRMLQASDHERQTISYEIHDGLAQYLSGATMQFQAHDALRENSPDQAKQAYETAVELVRQSHAEARRLISEVRPPVIDEVGIETAVSHLVHEQRRHGGPKIECHSDVQFKRLPPILENALYRIAQEALSNACKHSKSRKVTVTLAQDNQDVRLEVQDWGVGFTPESVEKGHFGLEGIRQRVRLLGGRLKIESEPGSGTLVQAVVPIVERQNEV